MKVGILTYHRANNFGAFLQAYGLCSRLNQEDDIDAEIIDFHMDKEIKMYDEKKNSIIFKILKYREYSFLKKRHKMFDKTIKQCCLSRDYLHSDDMVQFKKFVDGHYDIIVVGSDEIWKLDSFRGFPNPYWLPDNLNCLKVSYAASSRTDLKFVSRETIEMVRIFLNDFKIISVRDEITYNQFLKIISKEKNIQINADPSFVFDYKVNRQQGLHILAQRCKLLENKKNVVVMTDNKSTAAIIKKQLSDRYNLISVYCYHYGYKNIANLTPFEWIDVIAAADFVITSFFHGVCFSIVNQTPFLAIGTSYEKESKIMDVLKKTKNENRFISLNDLKKDNGLLLRNFLGNQIKPNGTEYIRKVKNEFKHYVDTLKKLYKNRNSKNT